MNTVIQERRPQIFYRRDTFATQDTPEEKRDDVVYPDSDGKPMADNTKQFEWIVKIKENLERIFADDPNVFVAGDLLWYPVKGNNKIRVAPDALVAFGRPKGYRGSYRTWEEDNVVPHVVFEVLSPGNTRKEMAAKREFYDRYGVEEYYEYDPDRIILKGWMRSGKRFEPIENIEDWVSPNLRIRFRLEPDDLYITGPDGKPFLTPVEWDRKYQHDLKQKQRVAEAERQRADAATLAAEAERQKAEAERQRAEKLAAKLREFGIEPE